MNYKNFIRFILSAVIILTFTSCGVWYNFKAYFNSYYNAKVLFDEVERNLEQNAVDVFTFTEKGASAKDYLSLTKVIEKCSKILQFDTQSDYFIDALWLSGKSFYYQREYVKAERKFKELSKIVQEEDELLDVKFWHAKTKLQLRSFAEGMNMLDTVSTEALKLKNDELFSNAVIKQIAFLIYREKFNEAIQKCDYFIKNSEDDELKAAVSFEMGQFYAKENNFEKAAEAYKAVSSYSPTFEIDYKSKLEYAKCLMDTGNIDGGMELLKDLKNKSQYSQYLNDITLELAIGYYYKKDYAQAMDIFTNIDTLYYGTKSSGVAEYMKAQIYEYHNINFDSAAFYYELANKNNEIEEEMSNRVEKKYSIFKKYIESRNELLNNIKQISYAEDKNAYLRDSVEYAETIYRDTLGQKDKMKGGQGGEGQQNIAQNQGQNQSRSQQETSQQTIPTSEESTASRAEAQSQQKTASAAGTGKNSARKMRPAIKKSLPVKPQYPKIGSDSLKTFLADRLYSLGNLFFAEMELADSAGYYYSKVVSDFPSKPVIPKAYFALGTYYLTEKNKPKADSIFQIIYDKYGKSEMAVQAAIKLGLIEETPKNDPAEIKYIEAEKKYYDKKYTEAVNDFRAIISAHPKSKMAPKAAYYIAFMFENDIKNIDSTVAAYEFLSKTYPSSEVALKVQSRISTYIKPKKAEEKPAAADTKNKKGSETAKDKAAIKEPTKAQADSIKVMMEKAKKKDALMKERMKKDKTDSLKIKEVI